MTPLEQIEERIKSYGENPTNLKNQTKQLLKSYQLDKWQLYLMNEKKSPNYLNLKTKLSCLEKALNNLLS